MPAERASEGHRGAWQVRVPFFSNWIDHHDTVLFRLIRLSRVTGQVDMAKIRRLSQVSEAVVGVEKLLVKKAKK
jgi:hypothetical protein